MSWISLTTSMEGCTLLMPLSDALGWPIDQVNFVICQLVAMLLGIPFRIFLGPHRASTTTRHVIEIILGLLITMFCFGSQVIHLGIQAFVCLALMHTLRPGIMEKAVFVWAMGYLCFGHIYRMYYDYGGYTLDITGPLMVSTQRLTSLAYNIVDGQSDSDKLSPNVRPHVVKSFPSLLEFTSYIFSFHMILCGPFCFYQDYIRFICGTNYRHAVTGDTSTSVATADSASNVETLPSPAATIGRKFAHVLLSFIVLQFSPMFDYRYVLEQEFKDSSFLYKMFYIITSTSLIRPKYYIAWKLSEAVNYSTGLGFNGYDEKGRSKWNLLDNAEVFDFEFSLSLKVLLDNWNKMTTLWLRYVVYERCHSTFAVFLFSAFWHGFYPGYYIMFLGAAMCIHASRLFRRHVRPLFQSGERLAFVYDVLTFLVTRVTVAYLTVPFALLEFWSSFEFYKQLYFWMHAAVVVTTVWLLVAPPVRTGEKPKQS